MSDKPSDNDKGRKAPRKNSSKPARNQIYLTEQPDYETAFGTHGSHLTDGGISPRTVPLRGPAVASTTTNATSTAPAMPSVPSTAAASSATGGPTMIAGPQVLVSRRQRGPYRFRTGTAGPPSGDDLWFNSSTSDDEEDRQRKRARRAARPQTLAPRMNRSHQNEDSDGDEEKEQNAAQQIEADHRLAELIEKELFELQGCDAKLGERVETNEDFITRPPPQYISYSSDNEKSTRMVRSVEIFLP